MLKITTKYPQMTTQYNVCPIPYRLDPYTGCTFGCKYCFARDVIQNVRKIAKKEGTEASFNYLTALDIKSLERWIKRVLVQDSDKPERIAFKERIPVKIGGVADPFPYVENKERITYNVLKLFHEIDYPVQITTKNPEMLLNYIDDFINPNWALSVTIISSKEEFRKNIEPYSPSVKNRLQAIKKLTNKGLKILVKIQPVFYPYIMNEIDELIYKIYESGAYAVQMEGLKVRIIMDKKEQGYFKEISDYVGYDIRQWYKDNGRRTKTDYELKTEDKLIYINKTKELCNQYGLKFFAGDNDCRCQGCSGECCGTEILRNYKTIYQSDKLLNCKVNFGRNRNNKTIKESIEENKR